MWGLEGGKQGGKWYNHIITSKVKEKCFKNKMNWLPSWGRWRGQKIRSGGAYVCRTRDGIGVGGMREGSNW